MSLEENVSTHYTHGDLLNAIIKGLGQLGKTSDTITIEELASLDEFHIGGRQASIDFLDQLNFSNHDHLVDVGCGLGGTSRFVSERYKCRVAGIDLTPEFIKAGEALCTWVELDHYITLQEGSALDMPFNDSVFDGGYMMHVGMNIDDKLKLFKEVYRVLRPGTNFGVYDVMQVEEGSLTYPVPWATTPSESKLASPEQYKKALKEVGFSINSERDRREFALSFFEQLKMKSNSNSGPPPLGLHILMGENASTKVQNMIKNVSAGYIAPVEIIARKD